MSLRMTYRVFPPLFLALMASGAAARAPKYPPSTGQSALYACADGRTIEVLYSGGDAAVVTIGDRTVQLARAVSADGERYVGEGWQWWGKGQREGMLSRTAGSDAAGIACTVR